MPDGSRIGNSCKFLTLLPVCLFAAYAAYAADYTEEECTALEHSLSQNPMATDVIAALEEGADGACYGKVLCRDADLCERIAEVEKKAPDADADQQTVKAAFQEQLAEAPGLLAEIRHLATVVVRDFPRLQTLKDKFDLWQNYGEMIINGVDREQRLRIGETEDSWPKDSGATVRVFDGEELDIFDLIEKACDEDSNACRNQYDFGRAYFELTRLQKRVLNIVSRPDRQAFLTKLRQVNARWDRFFDQGRSLGVLFPWELYANSLLYDATRDPEAFEGPPNQQIILLHPSIGVHFEPDAEDQIAQTIVLELLGYYRWSWGGEDGAEMRWPFGGSLIMSFDGQDDPNYGIMAHLPKNWSIGATIDDDSDVAVLLSIDLAKAIQDNNLVRRVLTNGF